MTTNLVASIATLLAWTGWYFLFRGIYFFVKSLREPLSGSRKPALIAFGVAGFGLISSTLLAPFPQGMIRLPIVWLVIPLFGWIGLIFLAVTVNKLFQSTQALSPFDRKAALSSAAVWGAITIGCIYVACQDKETDIRLIKGGIPFSIGTGIALIILLALSVGAMGWASKVSKSRGIAKGVVTHLALIAGSFVFGVPFASLVVTSFKEDRDMSSPNGYVWIPKVQETMPYKDPKNPLYEAVYRNQKVQGTVISESEDRYRIDISVPQSMRGVTFDVAKTDVKEISRDAKVVSAEIDGTPIKGFIAEDMEDGHQRVIVTEPASLKGTEKLFEPSQTEPVRNTGLRWKNYPEAIGFLPPETNSGLVYVKNTLLIVVLSVIGTIASSAITAYAFSRMTFPGRNLLFGIMLSTMMLPGAVTLLPQFLIFRGLGWIDTLMPLWVPAFFGSAFNIFMLRQFFAGIPMEFEDAAKIDGCSYLESFWRVMLPQIKPALAVIAIWTFMGAWNNFMGPLIYINSPENMPLSYAIQLFQGDRANEPGLMYAVVTLSLLPVLTVFFFAQRYFIEGVQLSGLGGR